MVWRLPSGNPPATTSADRNVQGYVWPASYRKLHTCWPQWQLCKLQCTLVSQWTPYICFTSQLNADRFGTAHSQFCHTHCTAQPHVDGSRCLQLSAEGGESRFLTQFNCSIWLIHADLNQKDKNKVVPPLSITWVAVQLHAFVSETLDGSEWFVLSYAPAALSPQNDLLCWDGALRGARNGSVQGEAELNFCSFWELHADCSVVQPSLSVSVTIRMQTGAVHFRQQLRQLSLAWSLMAQLQALPLFYRTDEAVSPEGQL